MGKSYVYEVVDSEGGTSDRPDPYAREMMGEQRGLSRMYLDAKTGKEVNRYAGESVELMRFDVDDEEDAHSAYLVLKDASGRQLSRDELLARLGNFDATLVDKLHDGKFNDLWSKNVEADGRIRMTNAGGEWTALVNDPKKLTGLHYEFDEVGNAQRTMNTAEGDKPTEFPEQWSRSAARFAAGMGMAGPGIPMFFQGDEFGAQNDFRWGNPSTWDSDWSWESLGKDWNWDKVTFNDARKASYERLFALPPEARAKDGEYRGLSAEDRKVFESLAAMPTEQRTEAMLDITRRQSFRFYQDAIALRHSSPACSVRTRGCTRTTRTRCWPSRGRREARSTCWWWGA